jgi:hypothetical protein
MKERHNPPQIGVEPYYDVTLYRISFLERIFAVWKSDFFRNDTEPIEKVITFYGTNNTQCKQQTHNDETTTQRRDHNTTRVRCSLWFATFRGQSRRSQTIRLGLGTAAASGIASIHQSITLLPLLDLYSRRTS